MAQTKSKAFGKFLNQCYGWGAAVVIIGALLKITHFEIGPITGTIMLTIGLCTEAIIFAISAFEPVKDQYDWSLVYPELENANAPKRQPKKADITEVEDSLSKKLDQMLKEAKIDGELMERLGESIKHFGDAAKNIAPTAEALNSQKKYSEEMNVAAAQMESLNSLYKIQLEASNRQTQANQAIAQNAEHLQEQMQTLTKNISNLNNVYGNMLTAMRPNN